LEGSIGPGGTRERGRIWIYGRSLSYRRRGGEEKMI
jgi:hypothetical protein